MRTKAARAAARAMAALVRRTKSAEPWVLNLTYVRAEGTDRLLNDDYANDRSDVDGGAFTITPPKR